MQAALKSLMKKAETYLYGKGFYDQVLRKVVLVQLFVFMAALIAGVALFWLTRWFLMFALGAGLILFNFWFLCQFVFKFFRGVYAMSLLFGQFIMFFLRFALTGVVLGAAFIHGGSPWAVSAGLLGSLACSTVTALLAIKSRRV